MLGSNNPIETATTRLAAGSRRQAMDWSLVLLSQGIESTIQHDPEAGWGLLVDSRESEPAISAIHLYQSENRHWPWRQEVFQPGLLFDWASLAWALLLALFFWLSDQPLQLRPPGMMDNRAVAHGQWWRLFTAEWLHADLSHLAGNATLGFVLLGLTMGRYGTGLGLLAAYLAGAGGNALVWLLALRPHQSLGASGMVMGCLGLLAVQSLPLRHPAAGARSLLSVGFPSRKHLITGLVGGLLLFIFLGLSPGSDVLAHAGGFLFGIVLGALLTFALGPRSKPGLNLVSGFLFLVFTLWPWWLALRHR
jgi:rhomboid protease GluP